MNDLAIRTLIAAMDQEAHELERTGYAPLAKRVRRWAAALAAVLAPQQKKEGTWPDVCVQRAFVEGAAWWEWHTSEATLFPSERDEAEDEAVRRYGPVAVVAEDDQR